MTQPTDLERFCAAMDGDWRVERYSLEDDGKTLRVHYRSLTNPMVLWSMTPTSGFDTVAPVGTVGRICFNWKREVNNA